MISLFAVYQFVKMLTTDFVDWPAYKLGIMDEDGKLLKKRKELKTRAEREAMTPYLILIKNIKRHMRLLPGGRTRLSSYATAMYLFKEHNMFTSSLLEETTEVNVDLDALLEYVEEEIAGSVGSGAIAGVKDDGDAIVSKSARSKYIRKNKKRKDYDTNV